MDLNIALSCVAKTFLEPAAYIYEDESVDIMKVIIEHTDIVSMAKDFSKNEGYVERVIPSLSSTQFKLHFRMLPSTFEFILSEIGEKLIRTTGGNEMVPADKQLLLSLWRFATPDSYRSIIERFNVGKATAVRAMRRIAKLLCELSQKYIVWPTEDKVQDIVHGFSCTSGFPDTIGAIGSTHINIPAPKRNPKAFLDWKGHHSIHLQAVCDHRRQFTHLYFENMDLVQGTCVFNLLPLQEYINDSHKFPNNTHLIGDATYELHQHLLVPYYFDNEHLTEHQQNYNSCHSSGRTIIESAFALLKGRWRSLQHVLAINRIDFTFCHILACCVLHNICLLKKDELQLQEQVIFLDVEETELQEERIEYNDSHVAETKRDNICANL